MENPASKKDNTLELELNTTIAAAHPDQAAASPIQVKDEQETQEQRTGQSESDDEHNESKKLNKLSPKAKIKSITNGFLEMIDYMDFSFEMAF